MCLEMLGQFVDALTQPSAIEPGAEAGVCLMGAVIANYLFFCFSASATTEDGPS